MARVVGVGPVRIGEFPKAKRYLWIYKGLAERSLNRQIGGKRGFDAPRGRGFLGRKWSTPVGAPVRGSERPTLHIRPGSGVKTNPLGI